MPDDASQTAEGWPAQCPVCGGNVSLDESNAEPEIPVSSCGHLTWLAGTEQTAVTVPLSAADHGSFDVIDRLVERLAGFDYVALRLDMRNILHVSSIGLTRLLGLYNRLKASDRRFVLCRVPPIVREVFAVTRLDALFSIEK
jgi:anti-anti-sigma factor